MFLRLFAMTTLLTASALANAQVTTPPPAAALPKVGVASPDGNLSVEVSHRQGRPPELRRLRDGKPVITPSRLGFLLTRRAQARTQLQPCRATATRSVDETWEQPWGERRFVRNHYNELRVTLTEKAGAARAASTWCSASTTTASASATSSRTSRR